MKVRSDDRRAGRSAQEPKSPPVPARALGELALFAGLAPATLAQLGRQAVLRTFEPGATLFRAAEPAAGLWLVLDGRVRVVREHDGRRVVLHEEREGGTLGEVPLFEQGGYPATAIAVSSTRCAFVGRAALASAMRDDPELAWRLLARLSARVRVLVERLDRATTHSVPQRLAAHLLARRVRQRSARVTLGGTQREIADELGTVREVVVRSLRGLAQAGVIRPLGAGRYQIVDEAALLAIARGRQR